MANGEIQPENQPPESPADGLLSDEIQEAFVAQFAPTTEQHRRFLEQSAKDLENEVAGIRAELESLREDQNAQPDSVRADRIRQLQNSLVLAETELVDRRKVRNDYRRL